MQLRMQVDIPTCHFSSRLLFRTVFTPKIRIKNLSESKPFGEIIGFIILWEVTTISSQSLGEFFDIIKFFDPNGF